MTIRERHTRKEREWFLCNKMPGSSTLAQKVHLQVERTRLKWSMPDDETVWGPFFLGIASNCKLTNVHSWNQIQFQMQSKTCPRETVELDINEEIKVKWLFAYIHVHNINELFVDGACEGWKLKNFKKFFKKVLIILKNNSSTFYQFPSLINLTLKRPSE